MYYTLFDTGIGRVLIEEEKNAVIKLSFDLIPENKNAVKKETPLLHKAFQELEEYLKGERHTFSVPLCPQGTPFQKKVWKALGNIPYGSTKSYGEIAKEIGKEKASRAVGMANHRNPIIILIPCHRVICGDGSIGGYGGGVALKEKLLNLEEKNKKSQPSV